MRLYLFEHCSICFRVRMAAALKHLHLQETVVLEDDSETMIGLVGKRVIPILVNVDPPGQAPGLGSGEGPGLRCFSGGADARRGAGRHRLPLPAASRGIV
jgi:hypothetical protein